MLPIMLDTRKLMYGPYKVQGTRFVPNMATRHNLNRGKKRNKLWPLRPISRGSEHE